MSAQRKRIGILATLVAASFSMVGANSGMQAHAADTNSGKKSTTLAGMTYPSLQELPELSGWWGLQGKAGSNPILDHARAYPPPFTPAAAAQFKAAMQNMPAASAGANYCKPARFIGFNGGFEGGIELLFTPGRVTLTNEVGLIRRIYTDGRKLPDDADDSNTGTAIGHWEGKVLVVETIGLNRNTQVPFEASGAPVIGKNAKITERMFLKEPDVLEIDYAIVAPELLSKPWTGTWLYNRERNHADHEVVGCVDNDRSMDPETGKQRFDMTPPADLPPPPAK